MFGGTGTMRTLRNHIGGEWVESSAGDCLELTNPATAEPLCRVPLSTARDVDQAVAAARAAFPAWRAVPPVVRARHLFRLKHVLDQRLDEIAAIITRENGKTLDEARGSLRRGIQNREHACGIPTLMMGRALEDVAAGIDCEYVRQPLGVFAAVTPFNFPAMVPMWFWPYAIAAGNTFILKPSEQVPLTATRIAELAHEAGLPPGVLNLVRSEEHTSELQSRLHLVCRLLLEKKKIIRIPRFIRRALPDQSPVRPPDDFTLPAHPSHLSLSPLSTRDRPMLHRPCCDTHYQPIY